MEHASPIVQAEVLGLLYDHDWEHYHSPDEIAQSYVDASPEIRAEIDNLLASY